LAPLAMVIKTVASVVVFGILALVGVLGAAHVVRPQRFRTHSTFCKGRQGEWTNTTVRIVGAVYLAFSLALMIDILVGTLSTK
jgi:hypothetical protein